MVRLNLYDQQEPTIAQLVGQQEDSLFRVILDDESHVIHHLLPPSVSNIQSEAKTPPKTKSSQKTKTF